MSRRTRRSPGHTSPGSTKTTPPTSDAISPKRTRGPRRAGVSNGYQRGATAQYLASRERVLGRRMALSMDAEVAAVQLLEQLGGRRLAEAWLQEALEVVNR